MKICTVSIDIEEDLADLAHDPIKTRTFQGVEQIHKILGVFKKFELRATLFLTGEVLEKYSSLAEIWSEEHEIGCHGYYHVPLFKLSLAEREKQLGNL
ncbi:MAG: hypothetical protein FJ004_11910 [Chloroflexi bacterium]|nr:hypothetical protein [Chloroflexota bacterium]MBM3708496.1 hypothetical protein [Actinomycetota bacterium]